MQTRNLSILSQQTAAFNTGGAWADVLQFLITVPEDGNYDIKAQCVIYCSNTATWGATIAIAVNGNKISPLILGIQGTAQGAFLPASVAMDNVGLKVGDVVSMQAIQNGGATQIYWAAGAGGSFQIIKRGV